MRAKFDKFFKGDKKYFVLDFFLLILFLSSGIITPLIINNISNNWNNILINKIAHIQESTTHLFNKNLSSLLVAKKKIKSELRYNLNPANPSYEGLLQMVNKKDYRKLSIEVLAPNGKLIAWNNQIAIKQNDILPLSFPAGDIHFYSTNLVTFLTVTDTINSDGDQYYFVISVPIEKHYELPNQYFNDVNFTKFLSQKYGTKFVIYYNPFEEKSDNNREYSFELINNDGSKIGLITLSKPTLDEELNYIYKVAYNVQSTLFILGFIFFGLGFKNEFSSIKFKFVKIFLFVVYLALARFIIFYIGFPSSFINGSLTQAAYFSSTFGWGIVKSPLEFFITAAFILVIAIKIYDYFQQFLESDNKKIFEIKSLFWLSLLSLSLIFQWIIRGFSSAIKSIIFDSTLRYFKEPELIPNLPSILMNLNVLLVGISAIVLLSCIIFYLNGFFKKYESKVQKKYFIYIFVFFQIEGLLFVLIENEPLITPFLSFIIITILFALSYRIYFFKSIKSINFIYFALVASIISITLMNYFNLDLEKTSLRTTTLEINRPNDNLLRFLISETLTNSIKDPKLLESFNDKESNYNSESFLLWAHSSLQKEPFNSSLNIYDDKLSLLGSFSTNGEDQNIQINNLSLPNTEKPKIIETYQSDDSTKKNVTGVISIIDKGIVQGYLVASIEYDLNTLFVNNIPDFLSSKNNLINSVLDINNLKIFIFDKNKLSQVYGNIYPSLDQIKPILNAHYNANKEAWINLNLNGENYFVYALKNSVNGNQVITAVATGEKKISWDLYNFFKIFLIQSLFILIYSLVILLLEFKNFRYSFRTQLMIAFLFVSIFPVIILAVYNRQLFEDKKQGAILDELNERTVYLQNLIREEIKELNNKEDIIQAFANAAKDINISYAIYDGNYQIYNSRDQYYKVGLFTYRLNPQVYYELNYLNYKEYLSKESIDNYYYTAFYKKIIIGHRDFIIGVNDVFNKVNLSFAVIDLDVFLFGVFSFATLLIIILSAFLAKTISTPIRLLTKATNSIAHGDLNVKLDNKAKGEVKDLFFGFNYMTNELMKNQTELAEIERENAWKEMAKQVAHEIKNPLTPMKLAMQQLIVSYKDKNINLDSIFEKVSTTILIQIENLSLIASEFSRFGRMPNLKLGEIDLIDILNETINLFIEEKTKIEIITDIDTALIESDKSQLRRMFINLFRNSIQADAKNIKVKIITSNSRYDLLFIDDGCGIPIEVRDKIFNANFTTKDKGMGLGLKMSKRFIESLGGEIRLIDSNDSGCIFKVSIPKLKT